jgi:hypothetical protein
MKNEQLFMISPPNSAIRSIDLELLKNLALYIYLSESIKIRINLRGKLCQKCRCQQCLPKEINRLHIAKFAVNRLWHYRKRFNCRKGHVREEELDSKGKIVRKQKELYSKTWKYVFNNMDFV